MHIANVYIPNNNFFLCGSIQIYEYRLFYKIKSMSMFIIFNYYKQIAVLSWASFNMSSNISYKCFYGAANGAVAGTGLISVICQSDSQAHI